MSISKIERPGIAECLEQFSEAVFATPWIAERVLAGQQFNCYKRADDSDDDDLDDEDRSYTLCLGPITSARLICNIEGKGLADIVQAAMKVATESFLERAAKTPTPNPPAQE